jgi:hypothetical protein
MAGIIAENSFPPSGTDKSLGNVKSHMYGQLFQAATTQH